MSCLAVVLSASRCGSRLVFRVNMTSEIVSLESVTEPGKAFYIISEVQIWHGYFGQCNGSSSLTKRENKQAYFPLQIPRGMITSWQA